MVLEVAIRSYYTLKKSWLFAVALSSILAIFILKFNEAKAQNITINTARNCDSNAVIFCGAGSVDQLISKFNGGDGRNSMSSIRNIYSFFGITSADINNMNDPKTQVQLGWVSKSGRVYDSDNKPIATNALTGGRENISGSTRENADGTVFFIRPPAVSFEQQFLASFVVMTNNRFDFAVLASCGNAVKATPIIPATPKPMPTPTPPPMTPTPTPSTTTNVCSGSTTNSAAQINSQGGNCSNNTTVVQTQTTTNTSPPPTTPVTPTTTPTQSVPTPASTLVNTGPGTADLALIFLASSSVGTLLYRRWLRSYYL